MRIILQLFSMLIVLLLSFVHASFAQADSSIPDEKYQLEQIAQSEIKNGPYSKDTQVFVERLAGTYNIHRIHTKATALYEKALEIAKKRLGPDAAELWLPMLTLAMSYDQQGSPEKADPLYLDLLVRHSKWKAEVRATVDAIKKKPSSELSDEEKELLKEDEEGLDTTYPDLAELVKSAADWIADWAPECQHLKKRVIWLRAKGQ